MKMQISGASCVLLAGLAGASTGYLIALSQAKKKLGGLKTVADSVAWGSHWLVTIALLLAFAALSGSLSVSENWRWIAVSSGVVAFAVALVASIRHFRTRQL
jgi:hypothetical protein